MRSHICRCDFSNSVSNHKALNCGDASRLTSCPPGFVSRSCPKIDRRPPASLTWDDSANAILLRACRFVTVTPITANRPAPCVHRRQLFEYRAAELFISTTDTPVWIKTVAVHICSRPSSSLQTHFRMPGEAVSPASCGPLIGWWRSSATSSDRASPSRRSATATHSFVIHPVAPRISRTVSSG